MYYQIVYGSTQFSGIAVSGDFIEGSTLTANYQVSDGNGFGTANVD